MTTKPAADAAQAPATASPYYPLNEYSGRLYKWSVERLTPENFLCLPFACIGVIVSIVARVFEGAIMLAVNACIAVKGIVWGHSVTAQPSNAAGKKGKTSETEETGDGKKAKKKDDAEESSSAKKGDKSAKAKKKDDADEAGSAKKSDKTSKAKSKDGADEAGSTKKGSSKKPVETDDSSESEESEEVSEAEEESEVSGSDDEGNVSDDEAEATPTKTKQPTITITKLKPLDLQSLAIKTAKSADTPEPPADPKAAKKPKAPDSTPADAKAAASPASGPTPAGPPETPLLKAPAISTITLPPADQRWANLGDLQPLTLGKKPTAADPTPPSPSAPPSPGIMAGVGQMASGLSNIARGAWRNTSGLIWGAGPRGCKRRELSEAPPATRGTNPRSNRQEGKRDQRGTVDASSLVVTERRKLGAEG